MARKRKPKVDLDERFTLHPQDPEKVLRTLLAPKPKPKDDEQREDDEAKPQP